LHYYLSTGITATGSFTYYDASEVITATPANVRRIEIVLTAQTGTGSYNNWEGQSIQRSSIAVKKYQ